MYQITMEIRVTARSDWAAATSWFVKPFSAHGNKQQM